MKSTTSVRCFLCAVLLALCACVSVAAEEISPQQEASRQEGSASADKAPPALAMPAEEERAVDLSVLVSDLAAFREALHKRVHPPSR